MASSSCSSVRRAAGSRRCCASSPGWRRSAAARSRSTAQSVTNVPASDRGLAMVFQSYALYPHMSVYKNMAFALENMGLGTERDRPAGPPRRRRCCSSPTISSASPRRSRAVSASASPSAAPSCAIPKIFLFDEPLSNLDAELRVATRKELAALHAEIGGTMIYVTHDQVEAMTLADRIVVLRAGRIEQVGTPLELYNHPANLFVAGFIGSPRMNLFPARVTGCRAGCARQRGAAESPYPRPAMSLPGPMSRWASRPEHIDVVGRGRGRSRHHPRPGRAARWRDLPLRIGSRPAAAHRAPGRTGGRTAATSELGLRLKRRGASPFRCGRKRDPHPLILLRRYFE